MPMLVELMAAGASLCDEPFCASHASSCSFAGGVPVLASIVDAECAAARAFARAIAERAGRHPNGLNPNHAAGANMYVDPSSPPAFASPLRLVLECYAEQQRLAIFAASAEAATALHEPVDCDRFFGRSTFSSHLSPPLAEQPRNNDPSHVVCVWPPSSLQAFARDTAAKGEALCPLQPIDAPFLLRRGPGAAWGSQRAPSDGVPSPPPPDFADRDYPPTGAAVRVIGARCIDIASQFIDTNAATLLLRAGASVNPFAPLTAPATFTLTPNVGASGGGDDVAASGAPDGNSPLHVACHCMGRIISSVSIHATIVVGTAGVNASPLDAAGRALAALLLEAGCDPTAANEQGKTPLDCLLAHKGAAERYPQTIALLTSEMLFGY